MPYRLLIKAASRATGRLGWLRGATGAVIGLLLAASITQLTLGSGHAAFPFLIASTGASAVLVFALPASPLAQPWSVLGGNMISAVIGLTIGAALQLPWLAAPLAVGMAIAMMSLCRCLHPPGGACALLGALSAPLDAGAGWETLLWPLALNIAALIAVGWLYNTVTGHPWPHRVPAPPAPPSTAPVVIYDMADLDAVLEEWDEVLDVSRDDLDALFRSVERQAQRRRERQ